MPLACLGGRGPVVWLRTLASACSPIQRMHDADELSNTDPPLIWAATFITPEQVLRDAGEAFPVYKRKDDLQ